MCMQKTVKQTSRSGNQYFDVHNDNLDSQMWFGKTGVNQVKIALKHNSLHSFKSQNNYFRPQTSVTTLIITNDVSFWSWSWQATLHFWEELRGFSIGLNANWVWCSCSLDNCKLEQSSLGLSISMLLLSGTAGSKLDSERKKKTKQTKNNKGPWIKPGGTPDEKWMEKKDVEKTWLF